MSLASYKCPRCGEQHTSDTTQCFCRPRWTEDDTLAYRAEVERLFRERTPAKSINDADVRTRVNRSEMRSWALKTRGKELPELDREWGLAQTRWTRAMIRRVIKQLDPEMYEQTCRLIKPGRNMEVL